jgi:hypothetical protein
MDPAVLALRKKLEYLTFFPPGFPKDSTWGPGPNAEIPPKLSSLTRHPQP